MASSLINGCLFVIIFLAAGRMMKIKEIVDLQNKVAAKLGRTELGIITPEHTLR